MEDNDLEQAKVFALMVRGLIAKEGTAAQRDEISVVEQEFAEFVKEFTENEDEEMADLRKSMLIVLMMEKIVDLQSEDVL